MDWIPAKLRRIRQELGLTQLKAAEASGLSQRDVSQLENGRKEGLPKEYIRFLHSRGVDLNWLFTSPVATAAELPAFLAPTAYAPAESREPALLLAAEEPVPYGSARPGAPQSAADAAAIRLVDAAAGRAYPRRYREPAFWQALPVAVLPLPALPPGPVRCFQVASPAPGSALQTGDWVVAQAVALPPAVESGALYVVVTGEQLLVTRLFSTADQPAVVLLRPDDSAGLTPGLARPDIMELWRVVGRLSFELPAAGPSAGAADAHYQDLLARVQRLEQERR